jgi:ABC-type oligopeptide transport system ATPase subunit
MYNQSGTQTLNNQKTEIKLNYQQVYELCKAVLKETNKPDNDHFDKNYIKEKTKSIINKINECNLFDDKQIEIQ